MLNAAMPVVADKIHLPAVQCEMVFIKYDFQYQLFHRLLCEEEKALDSE